MPGKDVDNVTSRMTIEALEGLRLKSDKEEEYVTPAKGNKGKNKDASKELTKEHTKEQSKTDHKPKTKTWAAVAATVTPEAPVASPDQKTTTVVAENPKEEKKAILKRVEGHREVPHRDGAHRDGGHHNTRLKFVNHEGRHLTRNLCAWQTIPGGCANPRCQHIHTMEDIVEAVGSNEHAFNYIVDYNINEARRILGLLEIARGAEQGLGPQMRDKLMPVLLKLGQYLTKTRIDSQMSVSNEISSLQ